MGQAFKTRGILQDASYALRVTSRDKGFFVFATLVIGLGVSKSALIGSLPPRANLDFSELKVTSGAGVGRRFKLRAGTAESDPKPS